MSTREYPGAVAAPAGSAASRRPGAPAPRLLVVDDEEPIRRVLSRFLRTRGYEVECAASGADALALLQQQPVALMLCDVRMPGMDGLEVIRTALAKHPELAVMMLSAVNDAPTATQALGGGALDYLVKPVDLPELETAVQRALYKRGLLMEQRRVEQLIREEVAQRTAELLREREALREMSIGIVESLVNAMEAKDEYLRGQSHRVAELAASIAAELRLPEETIEQVRLAGRLHDVGRIGVREAVLNKVGTLTEDELEHIRDHLRIGVEILAPLKHLGEVLTFVQDHHERWDGDGYQRGLAGTAISIGGRILAAADAFQAVTSRRAYREPLDPARALEYMEDLSGTLLDPEVFAALRRVVRRGRTLPFIGDED
ncbi:MAG TPA: HD domain-containing phosphohydrolase [Gemmatimonadaceae bacterium]|nr:HD domain-containing phosphohydrolase [Gemmatimonadaceae bacterium]